MFRQYTWSRLLPKPSRADVYLHPAGASRVAARKCNVAGVHTNSRRVEALRRLLEVDVKIRGWTVTSDGWLFLVGSRSYLRFRKFAGISATQRQWFDKAILRTTPALLARFSIINLWVNELFKRRKFNLNLPHGIQKLSLEYH